MARFHGRVGFGDSVESTPGVWTETIVEREYYGDVIRNIRGLSEATSVNPELTAQNAISIVADAYANDNIFAIRYVEWAGALWMVQTVEVQSPRLILILGGVYNGPTPPVT